jgi:glycosyltransferase involved in cell wall biosynthesis
MGLPTSLGVIARNEQATLPACLRSVAGLFPDIVLVDTGSTDRSGHSVSVAMPPSGTQKP